MDQTPFGGKMPRAIIFFKHFITCFIEDNFAFLAKSSSHERRHGLPGKAITPHFRLHLRRISPETTWRI